MPIDIVIRPRDEPIQRHRHVQKDYSHEAHMMPDNGSRSGSRIGGHLSRARRSRQSASRNARDVAARAGDFTGSFTQQALVWLVALKLLGVIVIFSTVVQYGFDLPKSLWSRALEWSIAAALIIAFVRHGTAIVPRGRVHLLV